MLGRLLERAHVGDARAVHEDIHRAEALSYRGERALHIGGAGHVANEGQGRPFARLDLADHLARDGLGDVHHGHASTGPCEPQHDGPADAGGSAGHDRDLPVELSTAAHRPYTRVALPQ